MYRNVRVSLACLVWLTTADTASAKACGDRFDMFELWCPEQCETAAWLGWNEFSFALRRSLSETPVEHNTER